MAALKFQLLDYTDYTTLHFTEKENALHFTINTLKYTTPSYTIRYYCIVLRYVIMQRQNLFKALDGIHLLSSYFMSLFLLKRLRTSPVISHSSCQNLS